MAKLRKTKTPKRPIPKAANEIEAAARELRLFIADLRKNGIPIRGPGGKVLLRIGGTDPKSADPLDIVGALMGFLTRGKGKPEAGE